MTCVAVPSSRPATDTVAVALESVTDWAGFSRAVRWLLAEDLVPESVRWTIAAATPPGLFDLPPLAARDLPGAPPLPLPRAFVEAAREVFLHAAPDRLALLHRLAVRIARDPRHWDDTLHADRLRFDRCRQEVRREIHKMHAFVRFRPIAAEPDDGGAAATRHVAWFEPAHHVLEAAAPFFARRFANLRWAILTPRASMAWDGRALVEGPGASGADRPPPDAGEALWLAYYRSIFNPARVKVAMMKKEMPVRFWPQLPEAALIAPLLAEAPARREAMIAAGGAPRGPRRCGAPVDAGAATPEAEAEGLDGLRRAIAHCRDCPGAESATQAVFGEDAAGGTGRQARLMIVGEQPGDQEDLRGRPFQGPAGQLLRAAFGTLGWPPQALYLTNAVKHFHHQLRGKRRLHQTPGQREALACLHWLEAEIEALRPSAAVALGATAARSLLGREVAILANEGRWFTRDDGLPVLVCRHPSALLRADAPPQSAPHRRWLQALAVAGTALEAPSGADEPMAVSA
jgi:DNA polymerase